MGKSTAQGALPVPIRCRRTAGLIKVPLGLLKEIVTQ